MNHVIDSIPVIIFLIAIFASQTAGSIREHRLYIKSTKKDRR